MGAHVYLKTTEIEAVHDACGRLSAMLEASSGEDKTLQASIDGLYSVIEKIGKTGQKKARRNLVKRALRAASV